MSHKPGTTLAGMNTELQTCDTPDALLAGMPDPQSVSALESHLLTLPQVDLYTSHVIHGGMCARTIMIAPDTVLTGALTNTDNICVVCGDITVTTDEGPVRLTGYHVLPAKAGAKRAGVTHALTAWTTIWPTTLTDIQAIEDEMTDEADQLQTRRAGIEYAAHAALEG